MDPLIETLSSDDFKRYGYRWSGIDRVIAQAYANHIILFVRSFQGMMRLIEVVQDFIRESNI
jgi:hypothetical protein